MKTCYVIGNPIRQSLSPLIHTAAYVKLGIENQYKFLPLELKESELKEFIESIKTSPIAGVSVTLPFKSKVIEYIDIMSPEASLIKAVNTIIFKDEKIVGLNTDCYGIQQSIILSGVSNIKNALVVGSGGAARSAIVALQNLNAKITIINRTFERAVLLAEEFGVSCTRSEALEDQKFDLLINTTSVGMFPDVDDLSVPLEIIQNTSCIFDTVYNPKNTRLIQEALRLNKSVIYGLNMFIHQAEKQFELYTGIRAPENAMREELERYFANE